MAEIVSSKVNGDNKLTYSISLDQRESLRLQGHLNNIHLIAEPTIQCPTNISCRGKNSATKYFIIPKKLRAELSFNEKTTCQRIDTKDKVIFVYLLDKFQK